MQGKSLRELPPERPRACNVRPPGRRMRHLGNREAPLLRGGGVFCSAGIRRLNAFLGLKSGCHTLYLIHAALSANLAL